MERRGLLMCSDPDLLDDVLRLAAAAGCELHRCVDPAHGRQHWPDAPLVLLDPAAAAGCASARLPRRPGVVVAVRGEPPPGVWRQAVAVGAEHVVSLPQAEAWLVAALAEAAEGRRRAGPVIAVVGGRGGAGASVLAAGVAVTAARGGRHALLVDCDPLGGGLDLVLGAEDVDGLRWPGLAVGSGGRIAASALHAALPSPDVGAGHDGRLALLSCDRSTRGPSAAAVASVIDAGRRGGDVVVCDLPRHPTDAAAAALGAADLTVLVVPADVRSAAAAARVAAVLGAQTARMNLVVRGPARGGIEPADVARAVGLPLLTSMRAEPATVRALERGGLAGRDRGQLAAAARHVLAAVGAGRATSAATAGQESR